MTCTDDLEVLLATAPDALVHYGPTAAKAADNLRVMTAFLRAGIDVVSTAMTPWVWPAMSLNPAAWIEPVREACEAGGSSLLHHRHRPRLRQRPVPDDADGPVR